MPGDTTVAVERYLRVDHQAEYRELEARVASILTSLKGISGITAEHMAVRTAAGLFDVSHMGEMEIAGKGALEAVQHITSNDASRTSSGELSRSSGYPRSPSVVLCAGTGESTSSAPSPTAVISRHPILLTRESTISEAIP